MAGHSRLKDGVASARLVPAIHVFSHSAFVKQDVDARDKPGHDSGWVEDFHLLTILVQSAIGEHVDHALLDSEVGGDG
jgi:hypothetical protein